MPEIIGGDPAFRDDDGSADPAVTAALTAYASGAGSEQAALTALAGARLLVPVVAVLADRAGHADEADQANQAGRAAAGPGPDQPGRSEKASEMAMPTLVGLDGRRAIPVFTSIQSLALWRPAARPVPVAAAGVWQAAVQESCAVVVDLAGPVPFAVEGARLAALGRGEPAPPLQADPDVAEAVAAVLSARMDIAGFQLLPGDAERDLTVGLLLTADQREPDVQRIAAEAGEAVLTALGGRPRRGVAIVLLGTSPGGA
ncbi:MAG: SseB family protein [Streptosporangiaceae bacterium]